MAEDNIVHRVPVVVFVEVYDAIDYKDARRVASSAVMDRCAGLAEFLRRGARWRLRVGQVASVTTAVEKGWLTLFSAERAYGTADPTEGDLLSPHRAPVEPE